MPAISLPTSIVYNPLAQWQELQRLRDGRRGEVVEPVRCETPALRMALEMDAARKAAEAEINEHTHLMTWLEGLKALPLAWR